MSMQALEVIELEQKAQLVHELDGNVMRLFFVWVFSKLILLFWFYILLIILYI